jgi:hypothetical protein
MSALRIVICIASLGVLTLAGCEQQSHIKEMSRHTWIPKTATWPELQALWHTENRLEFTLEQLQRGRGDGAKQGLSSRSFQDRLKKFEETPVPAEFATGEREEARKNLVTAVKKATAAASKGDQTELQKQNREITRLNNEIVTIPGQTAPDGAAAQQLAPTYVPTEQDKERLKPAKQS